MTGSSTDGIFEAAQGGSTNGGAGPAASAADVIFSERSFEQRGPCLYECDFGPAQQGARGALVALMHGYGEHCRRYDEVARFLAQRGHVVCLMDARGHGQSSGQRGYVREYDDYVDDFRAFVERARARHGARPLVIFGHSNGGLIAARSVLAGIPGASALVLTSPLLEFHARQRKVPDVLARVISRLLPRLPVPSGIRAEQLTHDEALREAHRQDRRVHGFATSRWYWAATLAARDALARAQRVTLPLLIVQAEQDQLVNPAATAEFLERARSADKTLIVRPGELHEVLNERARRDVYGIVATWIERHLP